MDLDEAFPNTQRKQLKSEPITDNVLFEMLQHLADHKLDRDYVIQLSIADANIAIFSEQLQVFKMALLS